MKGSASRPNSATMNGTRWAIRPATKATSRDNRSSLATTTLHFLLFAAARAAASCGRLSSASAPLPLSNSTNSPQMAKDSAAANRSIAARCASIPRPERCCCRVETLKIGDYALHDQRAYHRMPFGRSANQSNDIALFMLQQRRGTNSFHFALRHADTRGSGAHVYFRVRWAGLSASGASVPLLAFLTRKQQPH
jgi:hypothetical protein